MTTPRLLLLMLCLAVAPQAVLILAVMVDGCSVESKPSKPVELKAQADQPAKRVALDDTDPNNWVNLMDIYRCENGTFEIAVNDKVLIKDIKSIDAALDERKRYAESIADRERSRRGEVHDKPCGVKVELSK